MADEPVNPEGESVGSVPDESAPGPASIMTHVQETISVMMQQRSGNALVEKFTAEHIDRLIEADHEDRHRSRRYRLWSLIAIGVIFLVMCVVFLAFDNPEFITPIITAILGAGAGFGVGQYTARRPEGS